MPPLPAAPPPRPRRALLIFADALARDLRRRGWSRRFGPLLEAPGLRVAEGREEFDVHLFTAGPLPRVEPAAPPGPVTLHRQEGVGFAGRLENAVEHLARAGYAQVVLVGRDCPDLRAGDVRRAFAELARPGCRAVLGPDHRGGLYLIGLRTADRGALLAGVRWQRDTDFAELRARAGAGHAVVLPVKQDLDTWGDLRALARSAATLARWRDLAARLLALQESFVGAVLAAPPRVDALRRARCWRWQLPPPAFPAA